MGIVDDELGGYENVAAFTDAYGNVDFEGAYYAAAGLDGTEEFAEEEFTQVPGRPGLTFGGMPPAPRPLSASQPVLTDGAKVMVGGLATAKHHNNREGRLIRWHGDRGRWEVDLCREGVDHLLARPEHLEVISEALPGGYTRGGTLLSLDAWMPEIWMGLEHSLKRAGLDVFKLKGCQFSALTRNLHRFKCIIIVGVGSMGDRGSLGDLLTSSALRVAMVAWVRQGGHLVVHGELFVTDVVRWFDKPWDWGRDTYRRTTHVAGENTARVLGFDPQGYNAKACMLSQVPPGERMLSAAPDSVTHSMVPSMAGVPVGQDKCAVASGEFGRGRISFFGDVNAEPETLEAVAGMARVSCRGGGGGEPGLEMVD